MTQIRAGFTINNK